MCVNGCSVKMKNEEDSANSLTLLFLLKSAAASFEQLGGLKLKENCIFYNFTKTFYQDDTVTIREHLFDRVSMNKFKGLKNEISDILKDYKHESSKLFEVKKKCLSVNYADEEFKTKEIEKVLLVQEKTEKRLEKIDKLLEQIINSGNPREEYLKAHDWLKEHRAAKSINEFFVERFGDVIGATYRSYANNMKNIVDDGMDEDLIEGPKNARYVLLNHFKLTVGKNLTKALEFALTVGDRAKENGVSKDISDKEYKNMFAEDIKGFKTCIGKNAKFVKKTLNDLIICQPNVLYSTKKEYLKAAKKCVNAEKLYRTFVAKLTKIDNNLNNIPSFDTFIINSFDILIRLDCAGVGLTSGFFDFGGEETEKSKICMNFVANVFTAAYLNRVVKNNNDTKEDRSLITKKDIENLLLAFLIVRLKTYSYKD